MPLFHCIKCHHEWESVKTETKCEWCDGDSYMINEVTPLEKFISGVAELIRKIEKKKNEM